MDVGSEKLFRDKSDVKNFELSLETKVSQKGRTRQSKKENNGHSGTRQQNMQMFDIFFNIININN
jgi:hypothetical protein